ncbi:hypothetical protein O0L34_g17449 [Tuta absoluta]|nr:hypothetical protein O0L34_g17449 [Tuta absoluta]
MVSAIRIFVIAYMLCYCAIYLGVVGALVLARTLIEEKRKITIGKLRIVGHKCDIETRFTEDLYNPFSPQHSYIEISKNDSHVNEHKKQQVELILKSDINHQLRRHRDSKVT